ncbi:MAG: hypothetical protein J5911_05550 [Clostridia bacterium]|nr:hypothetical protein [Clostridia bacterium]
MINTLNAFREYANVFYPIKANANPKVVKLLNPYVRGYEVESIFHARYLINNIGISPNRILYSFQTTSLKDVDSLMKLGINHYVIDDIERCKYILKKGNQNEIKLNIVLRIDVLEVIYVDIIVKWGASVDDILYMKKLVREEGHFVEGISYYIPQEINSMENSIKVIKFIAQNIGIEENQVLDIGGGITYTELAMIKTRTNDIFKKDISLVIEPGRTLLNPNIDLVVTVYAIRKKKGHILVFIDSGIYSGLIDHLIKGRRFEMVSMKKGTNLESYIVCGNSSDISDVIGEYLLPNNIKEGDKLLIKGCGAYCSEMDMDFCKDKRANYILVDS